MKHRITYRNEPMELEPVKDFLPPPDRLVLREPTVKITISLSKDTVDFFKSQARRRGGQYQRMIRKLLDLYASRYAS